MNAIYRYDRIGSNQATLGFNACTYHGLEDEADWTCETQTNDAGWYAYGRHQNIKN